MNATLRLWSKLSVAIFGIWSNLGTPTPLELIFSLPMPPVMISYQYLSVNYICSRGMFMIFNNKIGNWTYQSKQVIFLRYSLILLCIYEEENFGPSW